MINRLSEAPVMTPAPGASKDAAGRQMNSHYQKGINNQQTTATNNAVQKQANAAVKQANTQATVASKTPAAAPAQPVDRNAVPAAQAGGLTPVTPTQATAGKASNVGVAGKAAQTVPQPLTPQQQPGPIGQTPLTGVMPGAQPVMADIHDVDEDHDHNTDGSRKKTGDSSDFNKDVDNFKNELRGAANKFGSRDWNKDAKELGSFGRGLMNQLKGFGKSFKDGMGNERPPRN